MSPVQFQTHVQSSNYHPQIGISEAKKTHYMRQFLSEKKLKIFCALRQMYGEPTRTRKRGEAGWRDGGGGGDWRGRERKSEIPVDCKPSFKTLLSGSGRACCKSAAFKLFQKAEIHFTVPG